MDLQPSPYFQPPGIPKQTPPQETHKLEVRGTLETDVTFELVWKTFVAWITRQTLLHRNILITRK